MSNAQPATHLEPLSFLWWPERQQQFEFLLHLLSYSDLSISIEGAAGAGKTAVVKRALNRIGQALGSVAWLDAHALQQPLESQFDELSESRTKAIHMLVIDNADALDTGDWQQVEAWLTAGVPRLLLTTRKQQSIERLDTRLHQIQLSPLPKEQARNCWNKVYGEQAPVPATVWPGDLTCPKQQPNQQRRSFAVPKGHLLALSCILISLGAAVYFQYRLEQAETQASQQQDMPAPAEADPLDIVLRNRRSANHDVLNTPEAVAQSKKMSETDVSIASVTADPVVERALGDHTEVRTEAVDETLSTDALQQWLLKKQAPASTSASAVTAPTEAATSTHNKPSHRKTGKTANKAVQGVAETKSSAGSNGKQSLALALKKPQHPLLSMKNSYYVLQMLGTRSENNAQAFIDQYQELPKKLWVYPALFKGKPWFVVVYGPFKGRQQAIQARANLPKKLLVQKPWLRRVKAIKEDITTFRSEVISKKSSQI